MDKAVFSDKLEIKHFQVTTDANGSDHAVF
ncbi:hypothetical protein GMA19_00533 [Paenibacillus polymyxa E681]|nr:hypothetical protein PPE_05140 [Paenibacillus polymyxa E681]QNV55384.1 hypothetical protein GE561_00534 [Paenibacillus polymyxa E681]QNV60220.1 hypothetical protein GMA19_00533 [Paenibacillus polymyxa E681]